MNKVEMSLDDIIKNSKDIRNYNRRGRNGPRGGGSSGATGGVRRNSGGANFKRSPARRGGGGGRPFRSPRGGGYRSAPYSKGDVDSMWTHDLYDTSGYRGGRSMGGAGGGAGSGKLIISNLDFGVSNDDIQELFSEFGPLKSVKLHYDRSGRSLGSADLNYERRSDAVKALKQYNGVPLDGRPMQIQLAADAASVFETNGGSVRSSGGYDRNNGASYGSYRPRGGSRGGPPRGAGGGRGSSRGGRGRGGRNAGGPKPTQEQLDAELDAYQEKMDVS